MELTSWYWRLINPICSLPGSYSGINCQSNMYFAFFFPFASIKENTNIMGNETENVRGEQKQHNKSDSCYWF